jgi:hypothetical protein
MRILQKYYFHYFVCIFTMAILIVPFVTFAVPLIKFKNKDGKDKSYCPYKCQSAEASISEKGEISIDCTPLTSKLVIAENTHPPNDKPRSFAEWDHFRCETIECGILVYKLTDGTYNTVSRCDPQATSYEEGENIPNKKFEEKLNSFFTGREDPSVKNPDLFSYNTLPEMFDEFRGLFKPLLKKEDGGEAPVDRVDKEMLMPQQDYSSFRFGEMQKELDDPYYGGRLPPEYQPAIPYVPTDGNRSNVTIDGDIYSVPTESLNKAQVEYYSNQYQSLNSGAYDNISKDLYENNYGYGGDFGVGYDGDTFEELFSDPDFGDPAILPAEPNVLKRTWDKVYGGVKGLFGF